jgi:replicative DNA helicase
MTEKKKTKIKIAPNSKESEMMVLGCMLTKVSSLNVGADALDSSDFYYSEHKTLFETLKGLYKSDKPADIHIVAEELKRIDKLDEIGGVAYLTSLAQYAGTSAYIEEYAEIIKNKSILRRMIDASQEIEKIAFDEPADVHESLDDAQAMFFAIGQHSNPKGGVHIKDLLSGVKAASGSPYLKELEARQELYLEKGEEALAFTGIPTGFHDLDKIINGLAPSNLIIFAARPAMGKTAFALNVAENACFKNGIPIGIFSLEMSAEQLLHRMICSQSEVESHKIITGALDGSEYQRVVEVANMMQKQTMIIDDQPGLKITDLRARARRMKEAYGIQMLVIDYLQLLSGSNSYLSGESRQHEISEISRMMKNLARELNIPILCLSQLSRKVEERHGHRPLMSDLRESGAIEQDADIVMLLLRREYYDPYDKPGMGEIIVGKNRHGKTGNVDVAYRKEFAQFVNYAPTEGEGENAHGAQDAFAAFPFE